ncbi:BatA domain-containing protein [Dyadobacter sp. CY326]|uniref:BatA domain-containing protein n=1 Tax=Dyadobacter sp. CY326 TaxID=2907300 RepID=UPI001F2F3B80|nr:BatA domain-containing protein [Dyadobacter sp. CY326]MCE7063802.1 BatA domain-containing protein [Dyadobacter sp. CY326]
MEFLNPNLLWGMLAITLPVIIHFWYQKKGNTIAWAASQWLTEKTSLQHRGLRLDEIPLLLIRCLLVMLLSVMLSKPIINWVKSKHARKQVHLVQSNANVASNFRFELESAMKKGEEVFWIAPANMEMKDINTVPQNSDDLLFLQQTINGLSDKNADIQLYISDVQNVSQLPKIYIPGSFKIHSIADSVRKPENPFLGFRKKTGKDEINILVNYKNAGEQLTVQAGLLALAEVHKIPFKVDLNKQPETTYDWIFTDQPVVNYNPKTLYVIPKKNSTVNAATNVIQVSDSLRIATSDMVRNGQLPEWLGNLMIAHFGLGKPGNMLSDKQLAAHFELTKPDKTRGESIFSQWIKLLFVLTLMAERWIALRKNIRTSHA